MTRSPQFQIGALKSISLAIACLICISLGCSDQVKLSGVVTLDSTPVEQGFVRFVPVEGTTGPASGSEIVSGQYQVKARGGLPEGTYRVEITAYRDIGVNTSSSNASQQESILGPAKEQYIPSKYNSDSEVTIVVSLDETSQRDFELHSPPKSTPRTRR